MNVFTFSGNLTRDCRTGRAPSGAAVANFTVAVKAGFGEREQTEFVDCALWGKRAEGRLPQFLTKGTYVIVSGEVRVDKREHEGRQFANMSVSVDKLSFAGRGSDSNSGSSTPAAPAIETLPGPSTPAALDPFDDMDSIPF